LATAQPCNFAHSSRKYAPAIQEARFKQDIHDAFYGEREFAIVDPNGYELNFAQSLNPQR
jgi:uncharacterized glyoxalase superfamily protein PhnB